ncbi:DUF3231 family protein (plasmid) [Pseudalkalibacillus hwajinpoensis]|uniref:DUF3231 family protein n=1 Tax=Guptibacillus hwajinpoensis TaxID=208199 RepID=UPI00325B1F5F
MESNHNHIKLTSSEVAKLWGSYLSDSLGICTISYFLKDVEDPDIREVLEYASDLSKRHIEIITDIFKEEKFPIPVGFIDQDVNLNAARLFSDSLMLYYIQNMGMMGINSYSVALPSTARKDIREFYTNCMQSSMELFNRASNVLQEKGLFIRAPHLPYPAQVEFVHKQHFLAGWLGKQRPLTTTEVCFLFENLYRNSLGSALLTGFSQVAQSNEVRVYMARGAEIAKHHSAVFSKFLSESNIPTPMSWDLSPLASKEPIFSDKLLMFHTTALNNAGLGYYGASMGGTPRKDVFGAYARLMVEVGEFAADGANIMIDNAWLEKPPSAPDRKDLAMG